MKNDPPLVCLITPGHVASTPRLVRNADALAEAGYAVHVVAGRHYPPADALDAELFSKARWRYTLVDYCGGPAVALRKLRRRFFRRLVTRPAFATAFVAARAHHSEIARLAAVASRIPAQIFLGHCLPGLPAAAFAAHARRVPYGFDAEDLHDAETDAAIDDRAESNARRILQSTLLPGCAHLTSASPLIGKRLGEAYGVNALTLLNVFPISEGPSIQARQDDINEQRPARFYWFSQTIGPGRGLEAVVAIVGRMRIPAELHLRGFVDLEYMSHLRSIARQCGLTRAITFLPPGSPDEMPRLASTFDLGLSTEESLPLSRDLCLTNKIFAYLLAGIPQLLSRTTGQTALAPTLGAACLLCNVADAEETAHRLDQFFSDFARVSAARHAAWTSARGQFCWDVEKEKLLASLKAALPV